MKNLHILSITLYTAMSLLVGVTANAQEQNPANGNQRRQRGQGGQRGQGQGGRGRAQLATMPLEYLKENLALKAEQEPKVKEIQEQYRKDLREAMQGGISAETATKLRDLSTKANDGITALLTDDQKKKAPTVIKEAQSFLQVGMRLEALMVLKLTEDQKKKFLEIGEKAQKETAELSREERRTKGREIRQRVTEEASKLLTDEQKKALAKFNEENPVRRRQNGNGNNNPNA